MRGGPAGVLRRHYPRYRSTAMTPSELWEGKQRVACLACLGLGSWIAGGGRRAAFFPRLASPTTQGTESLRKIEILIVFAPRRSEFSGVSC